MKREYTATVYLFHEEKALLHPHPKLKKWLPPGGHVEENETPIEAARREVLEETGLEITFLEEEYVKIDAYNAKSIERPFLCLLEAIPEHKGVPAHEHIDLIYLATPLIFQEVPGFKWLNYEELQGLELFPDTAEVLRLLLKEKKLVLFYQRR